MRSKPRLNIKVDGDNKAVSGGLSAALRAAISQADSRRCVYTGEPVTYSNLNTDHM